MSNATLNPADFMLDPLGRLVPIELVSAEEKTRDDLVKEMIDKAKALRLEMEGFKHSIMGDFGAFVELSAEKYGVNLGGRKGNVTLRSYDGKLLVQLAVSDTIIFDEKLQAGKALVDECINEWSSNSKPELRILVNDAFAVDQEGKISTYKVLALRKYNITHPKWQRAMQAIGEAVTVVSSKSYVRFYEVDADGGRHAITLDLAAV